MQQEHINSLLANISVCEPQTHKNLTIYPLEGRNASPPPYLLLDEAFERQSVEVTEIGAGIVAELIVRNKSDIDMLLINGEELLGAKQNRTVNVSMVVPANNTVRVPVSCTERGRWHEEQGDRKMKETGNHYTSETCRLSFNVSVFKSLKTNGTYSSDQQDVWNTISSTARALQVGSKTEAQSDIFRNKAAEIDEVSKYFHPVPNQCGVIGTINGAVRGLDLFGWPQTMEGAYMKLLKSYIVGAMSAAERETTGSLTAEEFFTGLHAAKTTTFLAPGKGRHILVESTNHQGMALVVDGKLFHFYCAPNLH